MILGIIDMAFINVSVALKGIVEYCILECLTVTYV